MQNIAKLCADSLRVISKEKYDVKLKASHAHELVAAFCGYKSQAAMLADTKHPITQLNKAEIIVMMPDDFIDRRRQSLNELPKELPSSYELGEAVYSVLFNDAFWSSPYPPFRSFEKLARFLVENNESYKYTFKFYLSIPVHHIVQIEEKEDAVILTILHSHKSASDEMIGSGMTTINLPRVAGRIAFGKPDIHLEQWTGGAKQTFTLLEVDQ